MAGSEVDEDWEFTAPPNADITLVLVGKMGYGKSATGNSILGRKAFESAPYSTSVTTTSQMQQTTLKDGRSVNVIDTPGLFDQYNGLEYVGKEIVNCIKMAKDGIHAILIVLSVGSRFSEEDHATIERLQIFFGDKIADHMVVVFTHADQLEGVTSSAYLERTCPALQKLIQLCKNRVVFFDNKTKDEGRKEAQVRELLDTVDSLIQNNGGKAFSDQIISEFKEGTLKLFNRKKEAKSMGYSEEKASQLMEEINRSYDDQLEQVAQMVEEKLNCTIGRLEKQLAEEQAARIQAEKLANNAWNKSDDEIRRLKEDLRRAQKETENLRKMAESKCSIL